MHVKTLKGTLKGTQCHLFLALKKGGRETFPIFLSDFRGWMKKKTLTSDRVLALNILHSQLEPFVSRPDGCCTPKENKICRQWRMKGGVGNSFLKRKDFVWSCPVGVVNSGHWFPSNQALSLSVFLHHLQISP